MKKRIIYVSLFCWLSLAVFFTLWQWKELSRFQNQAGLRFEHNGITVEQAEDYGEKEENQQMELTAWNKESQQNIQWKEMGIGTSGTVIKVYGNMARVLPFSMLHGGFTFGEDTSGCVVSSGLAWELFQTDRVVGNVVTYQEQDWIIRGVLDNETSILAVWQQNETEYMPYVELYAREGDPPAVSREKIKSGLGLWQESYFFAGSFYCSLVRLCLSLPFWCILGFAYKRFWQWNTKAGKVPKWAGRMGLALGIALGIRCSISFTADFIPSQWSDFGFWSQKWQEVLADISHRNQMQEIYWERQVLELAGRTVTGMLGILAGMFVMKKIPEIPLEKRKKL